MSTRLLRNEIAKTRHRHLGSITAAAVLSVVGLSLLGAAGGADRVTWPALLAGSSLAFPVVCPLLIAVLASRVVEVEHEGAGWLAAGTAGIGPGRLCRVKLALTGGVVTVATVLACVLLVVLGRFLGAGPPPLAPWLGHAAAVVAINLVVLGVQLLLSAWVENQLLALGLGMVGTILAAVSGGMPGWLAALTPWGQYCLAAAADYRGEALVRLTPAYGPIAALTVVAVVAFAALTRRLDAQEV